MGRNNFSFVKFGDLNLAIVSALLAEADQIFNADPRRRIPTLGPQHLRQRFSFSSRRHQ
jgi:hypothetical protein